MKRCCVCGKEIISQEAAILFVGERFDNKEICESCELKFELMMNGKDERQRERFANFFYEYMKKTPDKEVENYLSEALRDIGYKSPEQRNAEEMEEMIEETQSGWISVLRSLTWIGVVLGIVVSIVLGVVLGELLTAVIGVIVSVAGVAVSLLSPAWTMIVLDAASDLRRIRIISEMKQNGK